MTRTHSLIVIVGVVSLASAVSSQQRPNFSGRWVTVSPAQSAGQEQVVTQDETSLATEHASELVMVNWSPVQDAFALVTISLP